MEKTYFRPVSTVFRFLSAFELAFAVSLVLAAPGNAQTLQVTPGRVLMDESAVIRVDGLQPNERVTIQASLVDGAEVTWASQADFLADAQGTVDVSKQAPTRGSYETVSAMGLIWSMKPATKSSDAYRASQNQPFQTIEFHLLRNGKQESTAQLQQMRLGEGVRRARLDGNLHGFLFLPKGEGPFPGVLVVGGSEGGVPVPKALWLASHGFAAVALAYFRYEDLPQTLQAIPLEYFQTALRWMAQRQDIIADRIGVVGTSRGGELALQLGSLYSEIRAVVAYVPANVRYPACCNNARPYPAWTLQGAPLPFLAPGMGAGMRAGMNTKMNTSAEIQVEQTRGPILLISGQDDGVWPSSIMAEAVVARLGRTHFAYPVEHLKYPHAGHIAGRPEIIPEWGEVTNPFTNRAADMGGTPTGNAQSSLDAIPKVLEFLHRALGQ